MAQNQRSSADEALEESRKKIEEAKDAAAAAMGERPSEQASRSGVPDQDQPADEAGGFSPS
ncbi:MULTISPECIES: hypothetical protein [Amycolatopsis]|uniref:Uncharacterized protein n=2 Tax=Amycolatopsis TaxID=1813 RepID=A0A1I3QWH9_9PSEU|nr:hypothetical protein [Amycolatopsis sacchari]SFJ38080.1 hypothetical protein SAMN05421835_10514 [Amycolatopsis sacchari]